jgi:hypothetical protein
MKKTKPPAVGAAPSLCQDAARLVNEVLRRLAPPAEARRHFEIAQMEFLKGIRALLDARIERRSKAKTRGQAINIE